MKSAVRRHLWLHLIWLPVLAAAAPSGAPRVAAVTAVTAPVVDEVPLTGTLTSPRVAQVSSAVAGLVETLQVDVGDRVRQGDVLLALDQELEALGLQAARAASAQARAELADARRRLAEARELEAKVTIAATELRSLESQVQVSSAALRRYEAEQQRQAARLRRHTVKAPFAGVISRRMAEAGEWVTPGEAVLELIATEGLRLDFQVPQRFFPRVDTDSTLLITLAGVPGRRLPARIHTVVPVNDPSARTFLLRAHLSDDSVVTIPGMSVGGLLRVQSQRQGVVVPRDAVLRYPDGRTTVWTVEEQGERTLVSERTVALGRGFEGQVEITQGLEAGTRVVTQGNEALQEGQPVQVVPAS